MVGQDNSLAKAIRASGARMLIFCRCRCELGVRKTDLERMKELEAGNQHPHKIVADFTLDKLFLQEA